MNNFEIVNETNEKIKDLSTLKDLINFTLKHEDVNNSVFNIIFVDNKKIHELNKKYRNIDDTTDVITFALEDTSDFIDIGFRILGDVYISIEKAHEQAINYGHSFLREISFLIVHGILHLLGYDHILKKDEEIMFKLQELILDEYNIKR